MVKYNCNLVLIVKKHTQTLIFFFLLSASSSGGIIHTVVPVESRGFDRGIAFFDIASESGARIGFSTSLTAGIDFFTRSFGGLDIATRSNVLAERIESGSLINQSLDDVSDSRMGRIDWLGTDASIVVHSCVLGDSGESCLGFWPDGDRDGFLGLRITQSDGDHFGWFRLTNEDDPFLEFAYQSQPGVPIRAGAIPEPSTPLLLLGVSFLSLSRRRRLGICCSTW